ncbi:esterase/lipase family protein [Pseudoxanthomonas mexicana]|uniref:esterase/lipase family protein n=1 Tax=Pseudoxanthomonas mexicana TaxID=128785 RepID=UPI0028B21BDD|nr:alpha/beta hydrolase [Pseudoxanthomonas mexicana]
MKRGYARLAGLAAVLVLLNGCAVLREFRPAVEVAAMTPGEYIALKRGDVLTGGEFSAATVETIRVAGLDDGDSACAKPEAAECIPALADVQGLSNEQRLSALSELWLQQAQTLPDAAQRAAPDAGSPRLNAWLEVARHAYAYLFFSERTPDARAFEDRQTQVRDYYNLAVQEAASLLFASYRDRATEVDAVFRDGPWTLRIDLPDPDGPSGRQQATMPQELLPASSLSFAGLRSTFRRDGFGAELVAVTVDDPVTAVSDDAEDADGSARSRRRPGPAWSEMPATAITALLRFPGENLAQVLSTHEVELSAHDPYRDARFELQGQDVPLAANFTAGYGLWLARSGFNRQSLRSLFGREQGIDRPHLYLMQPYDPDRRIILMIHGLASSPEAWVNVANELMGDERIRARFQVWQFYYPTNMPIAFNHYAMRQTLDDALRHFDPAAAAIASSDMVLIGHSMGGVISRLMVSSSDGDALWDRLLAGRDLDEVRLQRVRRRIGPMLHFEPLPQVERAIFIASPHRGTDAAGGRLGRFIGRLVRLPLTLLEGFADVLEDLAQGDEARAGRGKPRLPNSIDNLDRSDPFVQAASGLPISPCVRYHSIIGHYDPKVPLAESDDGLVPYWSAHLDGAVSEKIVRSAHSVQETAPAIIEMRRILHEDIRDRDGAPTAAAAETGCRR